MSSSSKSSTMHHLLFNKSLSSMVKGIRSQKGENGGGKNAEKEYINKCIAEIKEELKTNFPDIKAVAIQKLIYLQMVGYDIGWCAFHIIELMSSAWFGHKRIGYLAASISFTKDTDVILLTTHLFRKGFNSSQGGGGGPTAATMAAEGFQYETGAAISCLANIVTPDLAQDLLSDVYTLMNSSRPYVRKKSVLVLLQLFRAWPKALRLSFDRLKEKLEDENQGVVSAAVYVICELAMKNPKNYLSLAPQLFRILTTSSNNWVLIKVVKLLGALVPLEPRLAKKLTEPLTDIISTTPAKSLLYECVNTLLCGELRSKTVVRLCLEKLRQFIEDPDQNLKYLGLLGLHKLLQKQPRVVSEHKDLILDCLSDDDITIRMRALDLITSMVSLKNLVGIIAKLMAHLDAAEGAGHYREHVLERILFICSQDNFAYISDFEWYVSVLVDLTHVHGVSRDNARKINQQLLDVVIRVPGVRSYAIKQMTNILLADRLHAKSSPSLVASSVLSSTTPGGPRDAAAATGPQGHMSEVLHAVGFIIGEYPEYISEQSDAFYADLLTHLSHDGVAALPTHVQKVFVQNMAKLLSAAMLQPFDNAGVKDQLSTVKSAQPKRRESDDADGDAADGDETADAEPTSSAAADEEPLPDEEEEDFDANGLRRRKHASLKRTFAQWHDFIARLLTILHAQLPLFTRADSVEVQERAVAYLQFVRWLIVYGEFESKVTGWKGAPAALASLQSASKPASVAATPVQTPAAAPAAYVTTKLDLLSLDPMAASNAAALSIFDSPALGAAASAAPVEPLFASIASSAPVASALKEKLRAVSIQFGLLYAERLNPVHPKAQKKVAVPKGLDLDQWINPGCEDIAADEEESEASEEEDNPYSTKKSPKPRGGLYDEEEMGGGSGGFGAKQPRQRKKKKPAQDELLSSVGFDEDAHKRPLTAADKEDARRRQERRRQQQMNDPYYIKDSGAASVENIPVRRLEDDDLPNLKVVEKSSRSKRDEEPKKPQKVFKVLKHADMPGASDDDDEDGAAGAKEKRKKHKKDRKSSSKAGGASSDSDNALDMDLTTPLGADEVMPRMKSYAESSAEKAAAQKKIDDAQAKSDEKHKKHKKDDRDRERKHEKKSKKESSSSSREKDSPAKTTASSASMSVFDLFDPMGAPAPTDNSSSASSARKSSTASSSSQAPPASSPSSAASADSSLRQRTLFKDSIFRVKSVATLVSASTVHVTLDLLLASGNAKKVAALPKVTLELKTGKYVQSITGGGGVKSNPKGCTVTVRDLAAGVAFTEKLVLDLSGTPLDRSFTLAGRLSYTADREGKGKEHESVDLELPMSTFVTPKKVSASDMATLIVASSKPPTSLAQATIALKKMRVSEVIRAITATTNVALVEAVNFTATYYGVMAHNQTSVAVLVKAKKGDESSVSVEVKTTSTKCSELLLEEITHKIK